MSDTLQFVVDVPSTQLKQEWISQCSMCSACRSVATRRSAMLVEGPVSERQAEEPLAKIEDHLFYTGGCFTFDLRQRSDKQQETTDILSVVLQFRPK
jgi:hypothetical protein